jgi:hypothetical protein
MPIKGRRPDNEIAMKSYVICHMVASVDGRTLTSRWRPEDAGRSGIFEHLHDQLGGDAWLVDRVTGQEYAKRNAYPPHTDQRYPREAWFARRATAAVAIFPAVDGAKARPASLTPAGTRPAPRPRCGR